MSLKRARAGLLGAVLAATLLSGCGYHVAGRVNLLPKTLQTIAIPPFNNGTMSYSLARLLPEDLTREFHSRTKYAITSDSQAADAVLQGSVVTMAAYPMVFDPKTGRATAVQVEVQLSVWLSDKRTGAMLYSSVNTRYRERYEVSLDPKAYFDESSAAARRLSQDVARDVVSSILAKF